MAKFNPRSIALATQATQSRRLRRPKHSFLIKTRPHVIQPFLIAPVLPGETLKNLTLQARVVTDPILNPITGWWQEYYVFYVKHRDLDARDTLTALMLDASTSLAAIDQTTAQRHTYHAGGASGSEVDWTQLCLERVVKCYFRDDDEDWNVAASMVEVINASGVTMPVAKINKEYWFESFIDSTAFPDTTVVDEGGAATHSAGDLDRARAQYEFLLQQQLTNMSYEDWLATFGVRQSSVELHKPELLRYLREWSYPTNTISPTDGSAKSAVSWGIAERADKDRFFKEPGFIFGVTVTRPKWYYKNQYGAGVQLLNTPYHWLPAVLRDDPATSLKLVDNGSGPLNGITNDYWVDTRDLFIYGDQFHNRATTDTDANFVALPSAAGAYKYPVESDLDALFVTASTACFVRQDGQVDLSIMANEMTATDFT